SNPLSKKTEWSITEFQMWLAGAYSLQGEDWVPNQEQWEMIVDIIYKLKDRPVAKKVLHPTHAPEMSPVLPPPPMPGAGAGAGSLLMGGDVDVPPEAKMSLSELNRRSGISKGGPSNGNVLSGAGGPG